MSGLIILLTSILVHTACRGAGCLSSTGCIHSPPCLYLNRAPTRLRILGYNCFARADNMSSALWLTEKNPCLLRKKRKLDTPY
ncbi:hypothetical protein F5X96DRAFT_638649, partial [Biscogniauxia mediterranea]